MPPVTAAAGALVAAFAVTVPSMVPVGTAEDIGGWQLQVVGYTPDATAQILRWDRTNKPPRPGRQFFLVRVRAMRTGPRPAYLHAGWRLRAKGKRYRYTTFSNSCGRLPEPDLRREDPRIFKNGVVEGYVCWSVRSADASRLVMFPAGRSVFFALR